jgi:Cysteine sulfinate desulfinase/cysteine desulfurase and related enzymes
MLTEQIEVSSTSACYSAADEPSHVLNTLGLDEDGLSLGHYTTHAVGDFAVACLRKTFDVCRNSLGGRDQF